MRAAMTSAAQRGRGSLVCCHTRDPSHDATPSVTSDATATSGAGADHRRSCPASEWDSAG